jgi:hypothetical protein
MGMYVHTPAAFGKNYSTNDVAFLKRSYEDCVLSGNEECRYGFN